MKKTLVILLLLCGPLRAVEVDMTNVPTADMLEQWDKANGLDKAMAEKFVDAIRDHGKADDKRCHDRALALTQYLGKDPEDFLRQPRPYLERALALADRAFVEDGPSGIRKLTPTAAVKAVCGDPVKVKESGEQFAMLASVFPRFLVPGLAKRELVRLGLPFWVASLKAALSVPCAPADRPGLFDDFEGTAEVYGVVPYADKGYPKVVIAADPEQPKNHCLRLNGPMNGWGCGVYFQSHYAFRPFANKTKIQARIKTAQDLDLYIRLSEDKQAPGGGEGWNAKTPLHIKASAQWQTVEVPFSELGRDMGHDGFKDWDKRGNNKIDMDAMRTVDLYVSKCAAEQVELWADDIEFK
jgi:hypothetical protein